MKKSLNYLLAGIGLLFVVFLFGPRVDAPVIDKPLPDLNISIENLPQWVAKKEAAFPNIKPNNESKIIFADSIPQKTKYVLVYLHGYSASSFEGDPVHRNVAKALGANLYLPRLYTHGLKEDDQSMLEYTGEKSLDSAREAIAVGKLLGENIIVMGTSTGSTLALTLAAHLDEIDALVLYSSNIRIRHPFDFVATLPWGLHFIRAVEGSKYNTISDLSPEKKRYWTWKYRLESAVELQKLLETTMIPSTFERINIPVFSGFYYKNEEEQDPTVSVSHMRTMFTQLGTPQELKKEQPFPNAMSHAMTSGLYNPNHENITQATIAFLNQVLK